MEEWKECKLEQVCENIYSGGTPATMVKEYWNGNLPWLSSGETGQRYIYSTEKTITQLGVDNSSTRYAYKNSTVVASAGQGYTRGQASFLTIDTYVNQSVIVLKPNIKLIDPKYLYFNIDNRYAELRQLSDGTSTRGSLSGKIMKDLSIKLPPLPTQQKIAAILSSLDDKIELNNKINTNLERQAGALFKNWFVDFEPFGGKMPEGWKVGKLSDISILSAGGDKPKEISDKITEDYKVPIYSNGLDNFGLYGYTNKAKIFEESVTVSARGTIGFVCLRMVPYVPIVRLISLIPKTDFVSAKYLYLHLLNCNITGTGTTQQQLTVPAFSKEQIIIPSKNAIDSFTNTVNPFFETIVHNRKENEKLSSMRDTLLPKLMNGEIKVDEVRK